MKRSLNSQRSETGVMTFRLWQRFQEQTQSIDVYCPIYARVLMLRLNLKQWLSETPLWSETPCGRVLT